jgi:uncharacterized protein YgfB (UPF0149 family)
MPASDFLVMTEVLGHAGALGEPAELHGQLCGLACLLGDRAGQSWVDDALADTAPGGARDAAEAALKAAAEGTLEALTEGDMSLALLLPDDDTPMDERAAQLGLWCRGFMHGLVQGAAPRALLETGLTGEIVRDFGAISEAGLGRDESLAEAEEAYAELVEFVRISVQLVFEEFDPQRAGGQGPTH